MIRDSFYYDLARKKNRWHEGDLKLILDFISEKQKTGKVKTLLEIGCGEAEILEHLSSLEYTGLDPTSAVIGRDRRLFPNQNFITGTAEDLPFGDENFDVVFLAQTIQFFTHPARAFSEIGRVVKRGGYVIILAPNLEWPFAKIPAVKHYSFWAKLDLFAKRVGDLGRRSFGDLPFRIITQNYVEKTGRFEKGDDDLKYIASAYEVATFFKSKGYRIIYRKPPIKIRTIKDVVKRLLNLIPVLRYYQGGMLFIFKKNGNES